MTTLIIFRHTDNERFEFSVKNKYNLSKKERIGIFEIMEVKKFTITSTKKSFIYEKQ